MASFVDTEKQLRELSRHKIVYHGRGYAYAAYARACGEGVACEMASTYSYKIDQGMAQRRISAYFSKAAPVPGRFYINVTLNVYL